MSKRCLHTFALCFTEPLWRKNHQERKVILERALLLGFWHKSLSRIDENLGGEAQQDLSSLSSERGRAGRFLSIVALV